MINLINKLEKNHSLTIDEYEYLITNRNEESARLLAEKAIQVRKKIYGTDVYIRGLIEISNICKNNCYYCGIRASNNSCERYRLTAEQILSCCDEGYPLGFRTFVLQGGEDAYFSDEVVCSVVSEIKQKYPDCAVTLSLGERSYESYKKLYDAGADRYLLRHETADKEHYQKLHPQEMSFKNRMECLNNLKKIGFQTGCGFMVGSPYQTAATLAKDLKFIEQFKPEMCGIGPFVPHKSTCFASEKAGTVELTCYLLSIVRLISPSILLPSTTALGSIDPYGREKGILSGANVVMPNLSPFELRSKYELYNNKLSGGAESAANVAELKQRMESIGYKIVTLKGDFKKI
ncbi:MAG: [FeFe] hydrogenase H-cluster radical SAM maturase HydE [Ruminococcaceae bacterium]|nr:[FeFe] hydrogenase H-cluster radical SAM maturase HydE [Oscillospiraceae bacterium]